MSVVNFSVAEVLEERINQTIKEWGFASKAEFFRFLAIDFIQRHKKENFINDPEIDRLSDQLSKLIDKKAALKNLPSAEEQLSDLVD